MEKKKERGRPTTATTRVSQKEEEKKGLLCNAPPKRQVLSSAPHLKASHQVCFSETQKRKSREGCCLQRQITSRVCINHKGRLIETDVERENGVMLTSEARGVAEAATGEFANS